MRLKYGLEETPPLSEFLLVSLQWLAVIGFILIIAGRVIAEMQYESGFEKTIYLQKVFFIAGLTLLAQLFFGHRLPLVIGPSAVLMVGIYASLESGFEAIYTSIAVCGAILFIFAITGKLNLLRRFFTERIVVVVLLLVAISLIPVIMDLILIEDPFYNLLFSIAFIISLFAFSVRFKSFWNFLVILWLLFGTMIHLWIFPKALIIPDLEIAGFFYGLNLNLTFKPEVIFAFLICFLALAINDLSSIYSLGEILKVSGMENRVTKGVSLTGISNLFSGFLGVVGMVNYTLSPGMISATKCASRSTLIPAGLVLIVIAFIPAVISLFGSIPKVVVGSIFLYIMCSQIAVALAMVKLEDIDSGLIVGFPVLLAVLIAFIPKTALDSFPEIIKPILGNSFVMGVLTAMLMEHLVFRSKYAGS
ncbi:MAG: solute carrier family 23 protein [Archaeoglobaceae archaeon]